MTPENRDRSNWSWKNLAAKHVLYFGRQIYYISRSCHLVLEKVFLVWKHNTIAPVELFAPKKQYLKNRFETFCTTVQKWLSWDSERKGRMRRSRKVLATFQFLRPSIERSKLLRKKHDLCRQMLLSHSENLLACFSLPPLLLPFFNLTQHPR